MFAVNAMVLPCVLNDQQISISLQLRTMPVEWLVIFIQQNDSFA